MLVLLGITITVSFFDSLNPSAIAQQMLLQAVVKNKRHIWFFILGVGLANFALGLAVYYGVANHLSGVAEQVFSRYPVPARGVETFLGIACVTAGVIMIIRKRDITGADADSKAKETGHRLTPAVLFFIGVIFCAVELTTALPYFGFLALLSSYGLALPYVCGFIFLYSLIYAAPLILLYFAYNRLSGTSLIAKLERILARVSAYILPAAILIVGIVMSADGGYALIQVNQ